MSRFTRKFVSILILFAFLLQPFTPLVVGAEGTENQKAQIDKAVADYQKTYDEIMAIDECELGSVSKWVIGAIDKVKEAWNKAKDFVSGVWNSRPTWLGGDSDEEKAAKAAAKEAEAAKLEKEKDELEGYLPQIEKANADIKKIKADAQKTMDLLKSGAFAEASKTDPSKVYSSMDENASALGIYQEALKEAGGTLLVAADGLTTATTILSSVSLVCTLISAGFPPAAPITGPIAAITKGAATATGIAASVLKAAGNTLVIAGEKAITGDKEFLTLAGKEATKAAAEQAISRVVGKGVSSFAGDYAKVLVNDIDDVAGQKIVSTVVKKVVGDTIAPVKKEVIGATKDLIDRVPEDIQLPAAQNQPGLSW